MQDISQALAQDNLPTNQQIIEIIQSFKQSKEMDTVHIMLDPRNKKTWTAVTHLLNVTLRMLDEKNEDENLQQMLYSYRKAQKEGEDSNSWLLFRILAMVVFSSNLRTAMSDLPNVADNLFKHFGDFQQYLRLISEEAENEKESGSKRKGKGPQQLSASRGPAVTVEKVPVKQPILPELPHKAEKSITDALSSTNISKDIDSIDSKMVAPKESMALSSSLITSVILKVTPARNDQKEQSKEDEKEREELHMTAEDVHFRYLEIARSFTRWLEPCAQNIKTNFLLHSLTAEAISLLTHDSVYGQCSPIFLDRPRMNKVAVEFKQLLKNCANGGDKLDPLIDELQGVRESIRKDVKFHDSTNKFLDLTSKSLKNPSYLDSEDSVIEYARIFRSIRDRVYENPDINLERLIESWREFVDELTTDVTTKQFFESTEKVKSLLCTKTYFLLI